MAHLQVKDALGNTIYIEGTGAGTDIDPFIPTGVVGQLTMANSISVVLASNQSDVPVGIADGDDVAQGALADVVVLAGAAGSTSAKLRRLTTDLDALLTELKVKADPTEAQLTAGLATSITATLTVTNGAYTIADVAGGLITFANAVSANGKSAILDSLKLSGVVAIPYEVWFFSADIATPRLDNAIFGLAAADGLIYLGMVPITAGDYAAAQTAFNNAAIRNIGLQMKAGAGTRNIYAYMKATAVTSPGTTTLYLTADFIQVD
jgi:hypothetical protein